MALIGLGTDIVQIDRIEAGLSRSKKLAERVLTSNELAVFLSHAQPARFLAKRFAAKEAAVKALGTGIGNGVGWQHIEVTNNEYGAPGLVFCDTFAKLCEQRGVTHAHLSIADEQAYAVATVVLESQG